MIADMLGFESIAERRSEADGYISASRLNCWLACPLKWADYRRHPHADFARVVRLQAGVSAVEGKIVIDNRINITPGQPPSGGMRPGFFFTYQQAAHLTAKLRRR